MAAKPQHNLQSISRHSLFAVAVVFYNILLFISVDTMSQHVFIEMITAHKSLSTDTTFKPLLSCNNKTSCTSH